MQRKSLADAVRWDVLRQQGIVCRMINRVAHAGDAEHGDHHPERINKARRDKTGSTDYETQNQQRAGAQTVHQKSRWCLEHRCYDVERRKSQSDLRVTDLI